MAQAKGLTGGVFGGEYEASRAAPCMDGVHGIDHKSMATICFDNCQILLNFVLKEA